MWHNPSQVVTERVYRWQPLVWEPGPSGSGIDLQLVWEWVWCSCTSCTSMHQSQSRAKAEEAEWRQKGLEAARGEWRRGREVVPWQYVQECRQFKWAQYKEINKSNSYKHPTTPPHDHLLCAHGCMSVLLSTIVHNYLLEFAWDLLECTILYLVLGHSLEVGHCLLCTHF